MALPVLPLHIHDGLGFGTAIVGLVTGSQFAASLASRFWSGRMCDDRGPKRAVMVGLVGATGAGLLYLVFNRVGRIIDRVGGRPAGRSCRVGRCGKLHHYGRDRLGDGPGRRAECRQGHRLDGHRNVRGVYRRRAASGSRCTGPAGSVPWRPPRRWRRLATVALVLPLRAAEADGKRSAGMLSVIRQIWLPGLGAALSSIGFGVIVTFGSLFFSQPGGGRRCGWLSPPMRWR